MSSNHASYSSLPRLPSWPLFLAAINRLLQAEPWALQRLQGFAGKTMALQALPLLDDTEHWLSIEASGLLSLIDPLQPADTESVAPRADVSLKVTLSGLLGLPWLAESEREAALLRAVRIEGDAELARTLADLAQHLRPDWEQGLSQYVGGALAWRITTSGQQVLSNLQQGAQSIVHGLSEYLTEEQGTLTPKAMLGDWLQGVRQVREGVDRLEKRIERLQALVAAKHPTQQRQDA